MKFEIVNPLEVPDWDKRMLESEDHSFFHTSSWANVMTRSFGYRPVYFIYSNKEKIKALLPMMDVRSIATGRRGVSLSFSDYCEPIADDRDIFLDLLERAIRYGSNSGWKYLELRGGRKYLPDTQVSARYLGHTLNLSTSEEELLGRFRSSTRRNINKAVASGVEVTRNISLESVEEFYRLHCITRKRHGVPPQPFSFFRNIHDCIICRNLGFVVLAKFERRTIAGAIYFHFGDKTIYKYGASDEKYQALRANNLVMWEAIKWCSRNGIKKFCFGRTEGGNEGLLQFKRGWGSDEKEICYYRYDIKKNAYVENKLQHESDNRLLEKLPMPVFKYVGKVLYRHMG